MKRSLLFNPCKHDSATRITAIENVTEQRIKWSKSNRLSSAKNVDKFFEKNFFGQKQIYPPTLGKNGGRIINKTKATDLFFC